MTQETRTQIETGAQMSERLTDRVAQAIFDSWPEKTREEFLWSYSDRKITFACKCPTCNVERDSKKPRRPFETGNIGQKMNGGKGAPALWANVAEPVRADGSLNIFCAHCSNKEREQQQLAVVDALMRRAEGKVEELTATGWAKNEAEAWQHAEVVAIIGRPAGSMAGAKQMVWGHPDVTAIQPFVPLSPVVGRLVQLLKAVDDEAVAEVVARENELVTCPLAKTRDGELPIQISLREARSASVFYSQNGGLDYVLAELCEEVLHDVAEDQSEEADMVRQLVKKLAAIMDAAPAGQTKLPLLFSSEAVNAIMSTLDPNGDFVYTVYTDGSGRKLRPFEPARNVLVRMARARIQREENASRSATRAAERQRHGLKQVACWLGGDRHSAINKG